MSGGPACSCPERQRPIKERRWVVTDRNCNHSAFSGYQRVPSDYSEVWCLVSGVPGRLAYHGAVRG